MRQPSIARLLTRHFLRRFLDNDLISPHVDLFENTAVACAAIVSSTLFVSVLLGGKYLFGFPPPGVVAISSLGDNFASLTFSMLAMALVAALQWQALSFDARDAANLGPLPLARGVLVRAKLSALGIFALGFAIALNLFPSTVFQACVVARMPVGVSGLVRLAAAHAVGGMLASAFGLFAVIALRELLRAVLGAIWFARVAAVVQGVLVLVLLSAILLTPAAADLLTSAWVFRGFPPPWIVPPLLFFGLEQTLAGGTIANVGGVQVAQRMSATNDRMLAAYRANEAFFRDCAAAAIVALATTALTAVLLYAWNVRRMPQPVASSRKRHHVLLTISALAAGLDSVRRAGLTFALQALIRSAPHRLSMAAAGALAVALSILLLERAGLRPVLDGATPPASLLALQTVVVTILLGGVRRAVRVPAELNANWMIQMAWRHGERRFLSGVKRAAIVGTALPALIALVPLHVWMISGKAAAAHFIIGVLYSVVVVEALFCGCTKVPLASSYEPLSHVKTLGPIVLVVFLLFVNVFARVERVALRSDQGVMNFAIGLTFAIIALRVLNYWRVRGHHTFKFDEPAEPATQWLGLSG